MEDALTSTQEESKMSQRTFAFAGVVLILTGLAALAFTMSIPMLGLNLWFLGPWRLWPVLVLGLGLLFVLPPILRRGRPGLGLLFIPGMPILTTGAILLLASLFNWWSVWEWLWPQLVLALALGFAFAAIYGHRPWLATPAIIFGLNGLVFQFCALTGLWEAWAVLWTIEPLSLGLALVVVGAARRTTGLLAGGLVVCGLAGCALVGMTAILAASALWPSWWFANLLGPAVIILAGFALLAWGLIARRASPGTALQPSRASTEVVESNA